MTVVTVIAILVGILQYTPLHFLSKNATDFVWGMVGGLAIGRVPLNTWWKFALPLVGILAVIIVVVLTVGALVL